MLMDPRVTSIPLKIKELNKNIDDIIWENGTDDPRLTFLANELKSYREKEANGELWEPNF